MQIAIESLGVIQQEPGTEIALSAQSLLTQEMEFVGDVTQWPVCLLWRQEIDAQSGHVQTARGLLTPVGSKGIEMVTPEIHHGIEGIMNALAEPPLRILMDGIVAVPSLRGIAAHIPVLAHGTAGDPHPGLECLDGMVECAHDMCHVVAPPLCLVLATPIFFEGGRIGEGGGIFGIADVVEMQSVEVITLHQFGAELLQVVGRTGHTGVEVILPVVLLHQFGVLAVQSLLAHLACLFHLIDGEGHHPGMEFHATLVALLNGKLQRVVPRVLSVLPREAEIPGFCLRGIDDGAAHTGLQQHGVDVYGLQAVQHLAQFLLLPLPPLGGTCLGTRPVQSHEGGDPYGTGLTFGKHPLLHPLLEREGCHPLLGTGRQRECGNGKQQEEEGAPLRLDISERDALLARIPYIIYNKGDYFFHGFFHFECKNTKNVQNLKIKGGDVLRIVKFFVILSPNLCIPSSVA